MKYKLNYEINLKDTDQELNKIHSDLQEIPHDIDADDLTEGMKIISEIIESMVKDYNEKGQSISSIKVNISGEF